MSCNKIPQAGWFHQQKCIFSQFWRLEVQDAGAVRAGSVRPFLLAYRQPPLLSAFTWPLLRAHGETVSSRVSSSSKDTSPAGLGPL